MNLSVSQGVSISWTAERILAAAEGSVEIAKKSKSSVKLCMLHDNGRRPGSSVGIATDFGLDGPGIESRWREIFRLSRPALGPIQPPVQWVPGLSRR